MSDVLHDLVFLCAAIPALVVARRYGQLPPVIPISAYPNGVPFARGPRWLLIVPAVLVALVLPLAAVVLRSSVSRTTAATSLSYALLIEVALFAALVLGLEAEVAVGALRRVPALAPYGAAAVLAATVVLTLVHA